MAQEVTRKEFNALKARVAKLEMGSPGSTGSTGAPTGPTGASGPSGATGSPATGPTGVQQDLVISTPSVELVSGGYKLSAKVAANKATTFTYLQIAVRGGGAKDLAFTPNRSLKADESLTLSGTGSGAGAFLAWVAYSLDGTTWVNGPQAMFSVPKPSTPSPLPPASPGDMTPGRDKVQLVGRSGLGFNHLVFRNSPAEADRWGKKRGVDVDGFLYFVARGSWQDMKNSLWGGGHRDWLESGRMIVVTLPIAPESEGDSMNQKGANNAYRDQQRDLGKFFADQGFNRWNAAFRWGWEMNGNWYRWSCNRPGGEDAYRKSIQNCVENVRAAGLTQATMTQCWNKGPGQTSQGLSAFAGREWIDVVGVDQYDMWGPSKNDGQWQDQLNKTPSLKANADLADAQGIQWSLDEGGNTHGNNDRDYGGDNDFYWKKRREFIRERGSNMAWDTIYDERGAPATLKHDFASNPNAYRTFDQLWRP